MRVDGEANSIYGRIPRNSKRVSKESREASRIGSPNDVCAAYTITLGGNVLVDGEIIKITPTARPGIRLVGRDDDDDDRGPSIRRFRVGPGEAVITATDAAGNIGSVACPVPQRQGDDDDDDRHDSTEK